MDDRQGLPEICQKTPAMAARTLAALLRSALGSDRVLSDAEVELLATSAWTSLHPAA